MGSRARRVADPLATRATVEIFPIAAPAESPKLLFGRKEFGPGRIEMDVIAHGLEITVAAAIDKKALVAPAKQMAEKFVSPVEARSTGTQQPFHAIHQIGFWRFDHQMEMIAHEAPGMDLPVGFGARLTECFNVSMNSWRSLSPRKISSR